MLLKNTKPDHRHCNNLHIADILFLHTILRFHLEYIRVLHTFFVHFHILHANQLPDKPYPNTDFFSCIHKSASYSIFTILYKHTKIDNFRIPPPIFSAIRLLCIESSCPNLLQALQCLLQIFFIQCRIPQKNGCFFWWNLSIDHKF